jgi:hypothetical protein
VGVYSPPIAESASSGSCSDNDIQPYDGVDAALCSTDEQPPQRQRRKITADSAPSGKRRSASHSVTQHVKDESTDESLNKQEQDEGVDDDRETIDLLIIGLPYTTGNDELRAHFELHGAVVMCEHKIDHATGARRGFGFVRFRDWPAQAAALSQRFFTIGNRRCELKVPYDKVDTQRARAHMFLSECTVGAFDGEHE